MIQRGRETAPDENAHHERKGKEMQQIILKIAKWLIKYVDGYSVHKNPGKRKKA